VKHLGVKPRITLPPTACRFSAPPQEKAPKDTYFYQDNKQLYCTFIGTQPPTMYKAVKETQNPRVAIQYDALFLEDQFLKPYYETDTQMVVLQHPQIGNVTIMCLIIDNTLSKRCSLHKQLSSLSYNLSNVSNCI
jgi:hypothetical protein